MCSNPKNWKRILPQVLTAWVDLGNGRLLQNGLKRQWKIFKNFSKKQQKNAEKRWKKHNYRRKNDDAKRMPQHMPNACQTHALQSSSSSSSSKEEEGKNATRCAPLAGAVATRENGETMTPEEMKAIRIKHLGERK